jgi:hypothetical protein
VSRWRRLAVPLFCVEGRVVLSFPDPRSKQLPAVSLLIQHLTQLWISLNLVSPLTKALQLLRKLDRINLQLRTEAIAAGFCYFVACHCLPVFAENLKALQLAGGDCWLDSLGCFVRRNWVAVAGDWGGWCRSVEQKQLAHGVTSTYPNSSSLGSETICTPGSELTYSRCSRYVSSVQLLNQQLRDAQRGACLDVVSCLWFRFCLHGLIPLKAHAIERENFGVSRFLWRSSHDKKQSARILEAARGFPARCYFLSANASTPDRNP